MAELSALIGSVLKELAQARYMADSYSCTLSELYESNAALRLFPVPRAEIEEAEFTLRFAVTDLVRAEGKLRGKVKGILTDHAAAIAVAVLDNLRDVDAAEAYPNWREAVTAIDEEQRRELRNVVVAGLLEGMMPLVSEGFVKGHGIGKLAGSINRSDVARAVNVRVRRWVAGLPFVREALEAVAAQETAERYRPFVRAIRNSVETRLDSVLDDLGNVELEDLYTLDIDATSDGLRDLPADSVTSLNIKLAVRNYVWADVEGENQSDYRILGPE